LDLLHPESENKIFMDMNFYICRVRQELEERTGQVLLSICLADRKPLASTHLSDFQLQDVLQKTSNIIKQHGLSNLVTVAMTMSLSDLLSHCLESLLLVGPQEGETKHIKDQVFSVLLQEVGQNIGSSVSNL
jgi:hypothetical protein